MIAPSDVEPVARPLLAELAARTGLESVYLTHINWRDHEQEILASANVRPADLWIPEEVKIDYSDAVCRYVLEGGPTATSDVPRVFPRSHVARFLGFRSFVSVPIELEGSAVFGTLCGASTKEVNLDVEQLELMRRSARVIGEWLVSNDADLPLILA